MEKPAPDPTVVLKVNIGCCKACAKKLKKLLLSINGVYNVAVDPEEKLVFVTGKVDPKVLIKAVEKLGKKVELVSLEERKKDRNNTETHNTHSETTRNKCAEKESVRQRAKHEYCCCQEDNSYKKKENDGHKVEDHVEPTKQFDTEICRDPYCRIHRRNGIIRDRAPPSERPAMFWPHSPSGYFNRANPHYRQMFREQPIPYDQHYHRSMPRPSYIVHPGRPMPGFGNFGNFGNFYQ